MDKGGGGVGFSPPDGGYGWVIVACFVFINSCLLPLTQCFGIIYEPQFHQMGITAAEISFLLHLNNSVMCSLGLISGPLLRRFDFRQVSFMGGFLVCLGTFLTTFARSYPALLLTIGILIGAGQGILLPGMYIAVNSYFKHRLTMAISFQVTGASLSQIFMPQVCRFLLVEFGVQGTVLLLAAVSFHAIPAIILLRPLPMKPKKQSTLLAEEEDRSSVPPAKRRSRLQEIIKMLDLELFGDRVYVIIVIGMGISFVSELNVVLMTPFILAELADFDITGVATAMSVQATADVLGRAVLPLFAYRIGVPCKIMYLTSLVGSSIGRTMLACAYDNANIVYTVSAIIGLSKGVKAVFQSVIIPKYVPREKLAAATGLSMVVNGVLSLILGPLIGLTHDLTNSYVYTLHTATFLSMFCLLLWAVDYLIADRKKSMDLSGDIEQINS